MVRRPESPNRCHSATRWRARLLVWAVLAATSACDLLEQPSEDPKLAAAGVEAEADGVATPQAPAEPTAEGSDDSAAKPAAAEPEQSAAEPVAVAPVPPSAEQAGDCPEDGDPSVGILISPIRPRSGEAVRIVAASLVDEDMLALRVEDDEGNPLQAEIDHRPGVPTAVIARLVAPEAGTKIRAIVGRDGKGMRCRSARVRRPVPKRVVSAAMTDGVWPVERRWNAAEEALFSAWVRALFHAPRGEELAWSALHEVTGDVDRNLLFDHFGWDEDDGPTKGGLFLRPDCADTPYFLRAYYAWKRRLPFGFRRCSRGKGERAPACGDLHGVVGAPDVDPVARLPGEMGVVQRFFKRTLAWGVHTGNGRTAFGDDATDFYPLKLSRRSLRPGTIYADPYGHIFVVAELMAAEGQEPGVLYAIDGQPDGSITRKRFWEGNFLWNPDPTLGGSGFKGFRPHRIDREATRGLAASTDAELGSLPGYGDVSAEQAKLQADGFYDHMDGLITPGVRDPFRAQREAIAALHESAMVRVTSVDNGEAHHKSSSSIVEMPEGFSIFETTGAWENFSTPARDLRLLIAIDVATGFEDKVARSPEAWGVEAAGGLESVRKRLAKERDALLSDPAYSFEYTRGDGSPWRLTLAELVARQAAFETAYNPNDCPAVRWGAAPKSEERAVCRRRAPADQQRKMKAYQMWFRERRRPPRGDPGPPVE